MRNIAVFLDGTRNKPEGTALTNVAKLYMFASAATKEGAPQLKYYTAGVGTYRALDKIWTTLTGVGVQIALRQAYQFIGANYENDTRIFVFGFSRGAFSARHLAGLIARVGVLRGQQLAAVRDAYEWYRWTVTGRAPQKQPPQLSPHPVHFLGLWDAVASTRPFIRGGNERLYGGELEPEILNVRHALARDERRYTFYPELYRGAPPRYVAKWFSGYHCDVGGGYPEEKSLISNAALHWMIEEARKCGFAVPDELPWKSNVGAEPTPWEYPWTRVLNRPRRHLYTD